MRIFSNAQDRSDPVLASNCGLPMFSTSPALSNLDSLSLSIVYLLRCRGASCVSLSDSEDDVEAFAMSLDFLDGYLAGSPACGEPISWWVRSNLAGSTGISAMRHGQRRPR